MTTPRAGSPPITLPPPFAVGLGPPSDPLPASTTRPSLAQPSAGYGTPAPHPATHQGPTVASTPVAPGRRVRRSRTGGIWIGVIVAAVVLVVLLTFVLQNTATVTIHFFGLSTGLPIAVALLLAAVCGVLLLAIPGTVRILQLRKAVKKPTESAAR